MSHYDFSRHLVIAQLNNQWGDGMRLVDETGQEERDLAVKFRSYARKVEVMWPDTAIMLETLAKNYDRDAERTVMKADLL